MARYNVNHACGHDQTHQLLGPTKARYSKIEWLETTDCTDCWKAAKQSDREVESTQAAEAAQSAGLPALTGSEKQIRWAETLRAKMLASFDDLSSRIGELSSQNQSGPLRAWGEFGDWLMSQSESRFWIDNRSRSFGDEMGRLETGDIGAALRMVVNGGGGSEADARDLWFRFLKKVHPEILVEIEQAKVEAVAAQQRAIEEREAAKRARAEEILAPVLAFDFSTLSDEELFDTEYVTIDSFDFGKALKPGFGPGDSFHRLVISREGYIRSIDGSNRIELEGEFYCWIDPAPESLKSINAMLHGRAVARETMRLAKASTFEVVRVEKRSPEDLRIHARDGRVARAFIDCGDIGVYQIGDYTLPSTSPEMERIAAQVRSML